MEISLYCFAVGLIFVEVTCKMCLDCVKFAMFYRDDIYCLIIL